MTCYIAAMSYVTLEVEIVHGQVVAKGTEKLPDKAAGLLTILPPAPETPAKMTQLEAFQALQRSLNLDEAKAKAWMDMIKDARR